jgi:hypothetical protein
LDVATFFNHLVRNVKSENSPYNAPVFSRDRCTRTGRERGGGAVEEGKSVAPIGLETREVVAANPATAMWSVPNCKMIVDDTENVLLGYLSLPGRDSAITQQLKTPYQPLQQEGNSVLRPLIFIHMTV